MLNRELLLVGAGRKADVAVPSNQRFRFITSKAGTDVNFFQNGGSVLPDASCFKVYINGAETAQDYTSISFAEGDEVIIQLVDDKQYYPYMKMYNSTASKQLNYIKEILEALPEMFVKSGWCNLICVNRFLSSMVFQWRAWHIGAVSAAEVPHCNKPSSARSNVGTRLSMTIPQSDPLPQGKYFCNFSS